MILESENNEKVKETQKEEESRLYYATNIDELNLLGDHGESEALFYKLPNETDEFRIDRLNL